VFRSFADYSKHPEVLKAKEHFAGLVEAQLKRMEYLKKDAKTPFIDFSKMPKIIVGICPGDGIGVEISKHAEVVLRHMLPNEIASKKIELRYIDGLTIENRAAVKKAIPDDVLAELKKCHVILKGPTTTPQKGQKWPNIESANVAMRKELDLYANVRPVAVPELGIDWMFFRENTEDLYALGSRGLDLKDMSFDFRLISEPGSERLIRMAFKYAKDNKKQKVTIVTKSNVVKCGDGRFSQVATRVAKEFPGIKWDEWYIDIMTAKLLDPARRSEFQVMALPNLYGDIITDEAAQIQGGVGTAGAANIGTKYAMFEAIHGSAPRMVDEGRAQYSDPSSMIKAASLLLRHVGYPSRAEKIDMALDIATQFEKKVKITGRNDGATAGEYTDYLLSWVDHDNLAAEWKRLAGKK
jgi:isocitrate dehydrogenase (NAD+)